MKLETFGPESTRVQSLDKPAISVTAGGRIGINIRAVELLEIHSGNRILFHKDEEGNWYLQPTRAAGFEVKNKGTKHRPNNSNHIQSRFICNQLTEAHERPCRFLLGRATEANGLLLYPLLKIKEP